MIRFLELWTVVTGVSLIIGTVWLWLETRYPPHVHDEGDHDPRCPGCVARQVRR